MFQSWIVLSTIPTLLNTLNPSHSPQLIEVALTRHYSELQGYFIYDTLYLLTYGTKYTTFLLHHLSCLYLLSHYLTYGFSSPWFHALIVIFGECANPFMNMRRIFRETHGKSSALYQANHLILLTLYFGCRILGFPIMLLCLYPEVMHDPMSSWLPTYFLTSAVYVVSIGWFARLLKS